MNAIENLTFLCVSLLKCSWSQLIGKRTATFSLLLVLNIHVYDGCAARATRQGSAAV